MRIYTIPRSGAYFIFSSKLIQGIEIKSSNDKLISKININKSVPQKFNLSVGDKIYYPSEFLGFLEILIDETTPINPSSGDFLSNGDVPMTGNLNFNNNKGINLKSPENDNDAVRLVDLDIKADKSDTYTKTEINIQLNNKQDNITLGDSSQVLLGDLSLSNKDKSLVGLNNVDNTSDSNKPISTLTQQALNLKSDLSFVNNSLSEKLDKSFYDTDILKYLEINNFSRASILSLIGNGTFIDMELIDTTSLPNFILYQTLEELQATVGLPNKWYYVVDTLTYYNWSTTSSSFVEVDKVGLSEQVTSQILTINNELLLKANLSYVDNQLLTKEPSISLGNSNQYWNGNKTWVNLPEMPILGTSITLGLTKIFTELGTNTDGTVNQNTLNTLFNDVNEKFNNYLKYPIGNKLPNTIIVIDPLNNNLTYSSVTLDDTTGLLDSNTVLYKIIDTSPYTLKSTLDDIFISLDTKEPTVSSGSINQYYRGDKTWQALNKSSVGLGNLDNTSDLDKPISSLTQTALNSKEDTISQGTITQYYRGDKTWQTLPIYNQATNLTLGLTKLYTSTGINIDGGLDQSSITTLLNSKQNNITLGTPSQVFLGDLSLAILNKNLVGLGNVDNTSDINKPVSTSTQTSLNLKLDNSTFNSQFRNSHYRIRRTGLTQSIPNSPTASLNIIPLLQNVSSTTGGQIRYLGGSFSNTVFPVLSNSSTIGNYKLPIIPNVEGYTVIITLKLSGTFATARDNADFGANLFISGVTNPLQLNLRRTIPNTAFSGLLDGTFPPIRVDSNTDPLILSTGGFRIELFNNNTGAGSTFTLTILELNVNFI